MLSNNRTIQSVTANDVTNEDTDSHSPPEYTETTTSFMEGGEGSTSDTDPLVPPPYVP